MSEQPVDPPEAENTEVIEGLIRVGSVKHRFVLNSDVSTDFLSDVMKLLLNYKTSITYILDEAESYVPVPRERSRPKGVFATMRDELLYQISMGNVPKDVAAGLHIAERSRLSHEAQKEYWRLVDAKKIVNPVARPNKYRKDSTQRT